MNAQKFTDLIKRYEEGNTSPAETILIERWLESRSALDPSGELDDDQLEQVRLRMFNKIKTQIHVKDNPLRIVWRIAAAVVMLCIMAYGVWTISVGAEQARSADFVAGSEKAMLKLADGTSVPLNGSVSAIPQQGVSQVHSGDGKLAYVSGAGSKQTIYNMISTPRGGQYQVTLADGSDVWLNATASLRFPVSFTGNERIVDLTGEAYFEIAKNPAMPFKVRLPSGAQVEVLGTHFNIMAYTDEAAIKTTLLEGSVKVTMSGVEDVILKPNQQALISKDGRITIQTVNTNQAVAWKDNKFIFKNTDIEEIMRQVSRWYDVDVIYEGDVTDLTFGGTISRKENVSAVLSLLELTGTVKFKIEERKITVMKMKK